jgi:hypothetical protein
MIVSVLSAAILLLGLYVGSHRLNGWQVAAVVGIGTLGLALVVFPQFASYAARLLGVGRGTDLLLYFAVMAGLFVGANLYFRHKRQEAQLIAIVRKLALIEANTSSQR